MRAKTACSSLFVLLCAFAIYQFHQQRFHDIRVMMFIVVWGAFLYLLYRYIAVKDLRETLLIPLCWLANLGIFYIARITNHPTNTLLLNTWVQIILLQGVISLVGGVIIYERYRLD